MITVGIRNDLQEEMTRLIKAADIPYFLTCMSKGFDETLPNFGGVYLGRGSVEGLQEAVESADCVLWLGSFNVYLDHSIGYKDSSELTWTERFQHGRIHRKGQATSHCGLSTFRGTFPREETATENEICKCFETLQIRSVLNPILTMVFRSYQP